MALFAIAELFIIISSSQAFNSLLFQDYAKSVDKFSGIFHEAIQRENQYDNVVMSALSADIAMSMLAAGAQGETKKQITDVLGLDDLETMYPSIRRTITGISNIKGAIINIANKVYVTSTSQIRPVPMYQSIVQDVFESDVEVIDFKNDVEAVAKINQWVEVKTNNSIKDLLNQEDITPEASAVLVNGVYFKGAWKTTFNKTKTKKRDFFKVDDTVVQADTMYLKERLFYKDSAELEAKILVLPYQEENVSMVIILPDTPDTLEELVEDLANGTSQYLNGLRQVDLKVLLPKFKIETDIELISVLRTLGIQQLFSPMSEVRGILENGNIMVTTAVQKAVIEVDEEGADAAAAPTLGDVPLIPRQFNADHPFMFAIMHGKVERNPDRNPPGLGNFIGIPILSGCVMDPTI